MPWKETQLLEARARFVWAVKAAHESFAGLCRQFGLSRKTGCKWWQRGRATGLKALEDRSRRPLRPPAACAPGWQERLRRARQQPPHWGPKKLRRWLGQRHPPARRFPAVSTLARWLGRLKLMGPPSRRARRGPVLKPQALTQARAANEVWTVGLQGLVSHRQRHAGRAADGARLAQPFHPGHSIVAQPERCRRARRPDPAVSPLGPAPSHPRGQRRSLWRPRRVGAGRGSRCGGGAWAWPWSLSGTLIPKTTPATNRGPACSKPRPPCRRRAPRKASRSAALAGGTTTTGCDRLKRWMNSSSLMFLNAASRAISSFVKRT